MLPLMVGADFLFLKRFGPQRAALSHYNLKWLDSESNDYTLWIGGSKIISIILLYDPRAQTALGGPVGKGSGVGACRIPDILTCLPKVDIYNNNIKNKSTVNCTIFISTMQDLD